VKEVFIFFIFFLVQLVIWASVAQLAFSRMEEFYYFKDSFRTMFYASLGKFDFDIFQDTQYNYYWGVVFFIFFMAINVGLFMSLFVAMVTALYGAFGDKANIYHMLDTLEIRSVTEADKEYSALISLPAPLNVLHIFLAPFLLTSRNPEAVNKSILWISYLPVLLATQIIFFVYNICITPLVFLKVFLHKMVMIFVYSKSHRVSRADKFMIWVAFAVVGIFRLYANVFKDNAAFLCHAVMTDIKKTKVAISEKKIDRQNMKKVHMYFNSRKERMIPFKQFSLEMREKLSIMTKICEFLRPEPLQPGSIANRAGHS
jgi:hypothetical protein